MHAFEGNFNRPQTPASGILGGFEANGRKRQNKLIWEGRFSWQYQRDKGQQWNNTSRHPDALPYIWADETVGTWARNHFKSSVQVGTTMTGNLQFGAGLLFEGGQGNRLNDPRPLYRFRELGIAPELALRVKKTNWLAVQLLYLSFSEDNEIGFFSVDDPLLFRLRGPATFTRTPFVSGERQLNSQQIGGGLRWVSEKQFAAQFRGTVSWGKAEEGVAIITPGGKWQILNASLLLQKSWQGKLRNSFSLSGNIVQNEGTDPTFQAINTRLQITKIGLAFQISKPDSTAFHWSLRTMANWQVRSQEDLATFTETNLQQLPLSLHLDGKWLKGKLRPFLLLHGHYQALLSENLQIGSPTFISENLLLPDFEILSSEFFSIGTGIGLDIGQGAKKFRFLLFARHIQSLGASQLFNQQHAGLSITFIPGSTLYLPKLFQGASNFGIF